MKYPGVTLGRVEAVWNKLGGEEGVDRFLRDELVVSESTLRWREQDGVIYFSVTSDGTTGPQWIKRLKKKGFQTSDWARQVLNSPDFVPTSGVTTEVTVLKGMLFEDADRITKNICAEASRRNLTKPNPEVACLVREAFSDEELEAMGLSWIVVMHEPIIDSDGDPGLLSMDGGGRWLGAGYGGPDCRWSRDDGFAFVITKMQA